MSLVYGSVCSGIEAASVAWSPLGWQCRFVSEIEKFPCAVLKHHYPSVPNFGDMTKFAEWPDDRIDVLVGGTPCQSFSVAGLRRGLADPRGNLALVYLGILDKYRPVWCIWENVPGVLSSNGGRDFGAFLGALGQLGYSFAYRVLDAQHFGVPQRRRRVFVIGHLGDWRRAAAVLFEREGLRGDTAEGKTATETPAACPRNGISWWDGSQIAPTFGARSIGQAMPDRGQFCAVVSPTVTSKWAKGSGGPAGSECGNLILASLLGGSTEARTVALRGREGGATAELGGTVATTLRASQGGGDKPYVLTDRLRRLTPIECERLQGFPDDWTKVTATTKDGPRYKAIGNSMAVPVMRWIGEGIAAIPPLSP